MTGNREQYREMLEKEYIIDGDVFRMVPMKELGYKIAGMALTCTVIGLVVGFCIGTVV